MKEKDTCQSQKNLLWLSLSWRRTGGAQQEGKILKGANGVRAEGDVNPSAQGRTFRIKRLGSV